jgi:RNA polymerase sigma-70 factor (ECF subfamily)
MDTDVLLDQAANGDESAVNVLLARHKPRLRHMVHVRMDPRLSARLDPSDIVQDALAEAHRRFPAYLEKREIPFYPWLRTIAWEKLLQMHRQHIFAERRTVRREVAQIGIAGDSKMMLVDRLAARAVSPSEQLVREELLARLEHAISLLSPRDHEVIVLKHLEDMTFSEAAAILNLTEEGVRSRYRRAIERLHSLLNS